MTSKISFSKLLRISLKNNIWGLAVSVAALLFALPIFAGIYLTRMSFMTYITYTQDLLHRLYLKNVCLSDNGLLIMVLVLCSAFNAIMGFRYLFNKSQCDLYHSLPLKRTELFLGNYLAGIISFALPYIVFDIITIAIGFSKKILIMADLPKLICFMFLFIMAYAVLYTVTLLAVMLTGTAMCCVLATITFFVYAQMLNGICSLLKTSFFVTYGWGNNSGSSFDLLSPVDIALGMIKVDEALKFSPLGFFTGIIALVILLFLVIVLYKNREIERAGSPIAYRAIEPVVSVLILVPAAIYGGLGANEFTSNGAYLWQKTGIAEYTWVIFGCLITLIIAHFVVQAIYYADFKSLFKNLYNPLVALLATAFIFTIFAFDLTGYDKKLPGYDYCAVSSYAMQSSQNYVDFDAQMNDDGYINYWVDANTYRFENMKLNKADVDIVLQKFLSDTNNYKQIMIEEAKKDEFSPNLAEYTDVQVRFTNSRGKWQERTYYVNLKESLDLYDKLYTNADYKTGVFPILTEDVLASGDDLLIEDALGADVLFKANDAGLKDFIETYRAELSAQTAYDLANEVPVAKIYFERKIKESDNYESNYDYNMGAIYPSFKKTLQKLEEMGVDIYRYKDVDNIREIIVNRYDDVDYAAQPKLAVEVYDDLQDNDSEEKYTDKADIERILDVATPDPFLSDEPALHPMENIDISVHYITMPKDGYEYKTFVLEKGKTF